EQVERPAQPLDPPAVAPASDRGPVVERVAPQLPAGGERVRWSARDRALLEELGMGAVIGAAGGDVDRDVAHEPHPALARVAPQLAPLALEPHLVGERATAGEALPVADPPAVALAEVVELGLRDEGAWMSQQRRRGRERRARLVRRAIAIG